MIFPPRSEDGMRSTQAVHCLPPSRVVSAVAPVAADDDYGDAVVACTNGCLVV